MTRRVPLFAVIVAVLAGSLLAAAASADTTGPLPLPPTMAAVGDSISQAASSGGSLGADYPQNSWSTGTNSTVNSHYLRLLALGAPISGQNHNHSVSGAKAAGLSAQMLTLDALNPEYLTVQIGGNDLCTDTFAGMTPVATFRAQFQAAMDTLASVSPDTHAYVTSIPDAYQLWSLFKNDWWARFIWSAGGVCQSLLASPTSTLQADVDRRAAVRQRNIDYNTQLREVCAQFAHCRFDSDAVFNTRFTTSDVAGDYFHPSIAGQAKLAAGTWAAGFTWSVPPPLNTPPTASFTYSCTYLDCTFTDTSTDPGGSIASRSWTFGDGGSATTANPSHTYGTGSSYTVGLTVIDNGGLSATTSTTITVAAPPPPEPMWVGALAGVSSASGRNSWVATVTVTVVGGSGATPVAVPGVAVSGSWSPGSGATSCTTGANGTCTFTSSSLSRKNVQSISFTVTGMTKSGWTYLASNNVASFITANKP